MKTKISRSLAKDITEHSKDKNEERLNLEIIGLLSNSFEKPPKLTDNWKKSLLHEITNSDSHVSFWHRLKFAGMATIVACLLSGAAIAGARSSLPGDNLYSIKRVSENARLKVQPDYINNIVAERKNEIVDLQNKKADTNKIQEAKIEYNKAVDDANKAGYSSYKKTDIAQQQNNKNDKKDNTAPAVKGYTSIEKDKSTSGDTNSSSDVKNK